MAAGFSRYSHLDGRTTPSQGAASQAKATKKQKDRTKRRQETQTTGAEAGLEKHGEACHSGTPQKKIGVTLAERRLLGLQPDLHNVQRCDCKHRFIHHAFIHSLGALS